MITPDFLKVKNMYKLKFNAFKIMSLPAQICFFRVFKFVIQSTAGGGQSPPCEATCRIYGNTYI